ELNPVEGVWSLLKRGEIANRVLVDVDHLTGLVRRGMRRVGRCPDLLEGCLAGTGLTLTPSHDQPVDLAH
ncbi:hypothetical protein MXD59_26170, partial [Frankia sp. Ag45/Mut15]|nr:hypothetical protein [Frankia umida]